MAGSLNRDLMFAYSDRERTGRVESPLIETGKSGYYECLIKEEKDCGFYEIWDNRNDPNGIFSDKYCTIGKLDARGLQDRCIYSNHIEDGAVTATKIAKESISAIHLDNSTFKLSKLQHEIQNEYRGTGDKTQQSPARTKEDKFIFTSLIKSMMRCPLFRLAICATAISSLII